MRILLTGGAGFIGSNFVRMFAAGEFSSVDSVVIVDKLSYAGDIENIKNSISSTIEFVQGDVCDSDLMDSLTASSDVVLNFAAESHVDRSISNATVFATTNFLGTQTLLDCAIKNKVSLFFQISTDEVYGSISDGSWSEDFPLLPNSPYSASKASADLIARCYYRTFGLDVRTTRCSNNYGPYQFPEKIIPLFVTNLIDKKKVPLYGKGLNVRDWLHVDDHCRGIHAVLMKGSAGEIYNIGGGRELTNRELTSIILDKMGSDDSSIEYVQDRFGHDLRYSVSIKKISSELGYEPQVKFEDGIEQTVDWYKSNEKWWRPLKK